MKAYIISDKDFETETYRDLFAYISSYLETKDFEIEHRSVGRDEITPCMGCFGCWVRKPGECVIQDGMTELNDRCMNSDVVIYLSPVVFGQFSANIKNVIDRWLPNMLHYFTKRPDGSTIHKPRYATYPMQFIIGYGEAVSTEDSQLFVDITMKHRRNIEAVVYRGNNSEIGDLFERNKLERVDGGL